MVGQIKPDKSEIEGNNHCPVLVKPKSEEETPEGRKMQSSESVTVVHDPLQIRGVEEKEKGIEFTQTEIEYLEPIKNAYQKKGRVVTLDKIAKDLSFDYFLETGDRQGFESFLKSFFASIKSLPEQEALQRAYTPAKAYRAYVKLAQIIRKIPKDQTVLRLNIGRAAIRDLTIIPPDIGLLTNLEELCITGSDMPLIVRLGNVQSLVTHLPSSLGRLQNLKHLSILNLNNLQELPKELENCKKLESLELNHLSALRAVPDFVSEFQNLKEIYLQYVGLNSFPAQLPASFEKLHISYIFIENYLGYRILPSLLKRLIEEFREFIDEPARVTIDSVLRECPYYDSL